ncbi:MULTISPECIES: ATP-binding protein [Noviherbaspirillum]|jgi:signal transduction histidine kinase|uniref:histidine kinase n=1 Tax=Noviherbaspirillum album TaxID=3080276 RepID=A0ABU6J423_9BURK|nr:MULTISPECIES: ATP-binding protein [Noviherbaspirillum]MEC4718372.1 ATP-binding protein [Noviherbaspirillum sp. CPCC 100848]
MTLRLRLMVIIGVSFTLLWSVTSVWMFLDVRAEFRDALDERLAASARMVAGLVSQLPEVQGAPSSVPQAMLDVATRDGVACEVRMQRGGLIARTHNSPQGLGMVTSGYSTRTIDGLEWRSYTLEQGGKRVTTADRVDKRLALLRNIMLATVVPFIVAMLGSLVVLWFGIRRGLEPLEFIRQALADRKPDAATPLPAAKLPAELVPLIETINLLLGRTQSAIERERRFTGDAAHELRTPLTAVKTHIQVARLTTNDEQTAMSLEHAEEGVQRLQHTLEQLLTLARVEGPFSFEGEKTASAFEIAQIALNEIPPEPRKRIVIDTVNEQNGLALPPVLVVTALRNLLDNALRYSPSDSPVILRLSSSKDTFCFSVLDLGPGMDELDRDRAAHRFWRKGTGQGSGLGLSIVEAIARRFGGSFRLVKRMEDGMMAQIELPLVKSPRASSTTLQH